MRIVDMADPNATITKIRKLFDEMAEPYREWHPADWTYLVILCADYLVERLREDRERSRDADDRDKPSSITGAAPSHKVY